jgi:hypothetical protein
VNKLNTSTLELAGLVIDRLKNLKDNPRIPSFDLLTELFEILFYTSISREEKEFIKISVTFIDRKNPDPSPPARIIKDRWNAIAFESPISFNLNNVIKLAKAADPWSSSLAIDFNDNNELIIWGLIDQVIHYQSFLHNETDSGPAPPGLFQASILGLGNIMVMIDYELIANLKLNKIISNYPDVLERGEVHKLLKSFFKNSTKKIKKFLKREFPVELEFFEEESITNMFSTIISRILIKIQKYEHGGALIITNIISNDLDIKHKINYNRIANSIYNLYTSSLKRYNYRERLIDYYHDETKKKIPTELHLGEARSNIDIEETNDELKGIIRFIASLSCIDGLIVLTPELNVNGFGAVITLTN